MFIRKSITWIEHKLEYGSALAFQSLRNCQNAGSLAVVSLWSSYIIINVRDAPVCIAIHKSHLNWQLLKVDQKYSAHLPGILLRESDAELTVVKDEASEVN